MRYIHIKGFSLYEISVVMLIIGLLAAGINTGTQMIEASKINKTINKIQELYSGMNLFVGQYGQLPGDFNNASSLWVTCVDSGANTCNGNNDKQITTHTINGTPQETLRALQHLGLANYIGGSFTGIDASASPYFVIGTNVMPTGFVNVGLLPASAVYNNGTQILIASNRSNLDWTGSGLTPLQSYQIDVKLDDGYSGTGLLHFNSTNGNPCVTGNTFTFSSTIMGCTGYFLFQSTGEN